MTQVPLLIVSDDPSRTTGLARITRDLATILSSTTRWRVATLGLGGTGSSRLPFHTYRMELDEFGERTLPSVWDEWSRGESGVVFTIQDLSKMLWLARPDYVEQDATREWLLNARQRKFKVWSYVVVDSVGPGNALTGMMRECLMGIDRIVVTSPWAEGIVRNTIGEDESARRGLGWMPHGINRKVFTCE